MPVFHPHHHHTKKLLCLLLSAASHAHSQSLDPVENIPVEEINKTYFDIHVGLDSWAIEHHLPADDVLETAGITRSMVTDSIRMPDSLTNWAYRSISPWASAHLIQPLNPKVGLAIKAMVNQSTGMRLDEFSLEYKLSHAMGLRAGIVDYKMSLCKEYDMHNYWIQDPNEFCADPTNKTLTSAAPGIQAYFNRRASPYRIQSLVGIYNAKLLGYSDYENGRRTLTAQAPTDSNQKWGAAVDIVNMQTGNQYRFSWLRSVIKESALVALGNDTSSQTNDIFYLATQSALGQNLSLGLSASYFKGDTLESQHQTVADRYDLEYDTELSIANWGASLSYDKNTDKYSVAYYNLNRRKIYSGMDLTDANNPIIIAQTERSNYTRQALALSWTRKWFGGMTSIVQVMHTVLDLSLEGVPPTNSTANALGLRLSYHF